MARAEIHILGSKSGYTTLAASPGVSDGERAELEVLVFGDATSSEARSRLERHAVMTGRPLRSGRFAISRMLPGGIDDVGRPTVEIVTLVIGAADFALVSSGLGQLASSTREWNEARRLVRSGMDLDLPDGEHDACDAGVLRAYETWVAACRAGSVGLLDDQEQEALLALIALLEPSDQRRCRWGVGLLSVSAPVDICTLSPGAGTVGARPVLRAAPGGASLLPEHDYLQWFVEQNGTLPRSDALVATKVERVSDAAPRASVARPQVSRAAGSGGGALRAGSSRRMTVIAAISAALSIGLFIALAAAYLRRGESGAGGASDAALVADASSPAEAQAQLASAPAPDGPVGESAMDRIIREERERKLAEEAAAALVAQSPVPAAEASPEKQPSPEPVQPPPPALGSNDSSSEPASTQSLTVDGPSVSIEGCFKEFRETRAVEVTLQQEPSGETTGLSQDLSIALSTLITCLSQLNQVTREQLQERFDRDWKPVRQRSSITRNEVETQLLGGADSSTISQACQRLLDMCFDETNKTTNVPKQKTQAELDEHWRGEFRERLKPILERLREAPTCSELEDLKSESPDPSAVASHRKQVAQMEQKIDDAMQSAAVDLWHLELETKIVVGTNERLRNSQSHKRSEETRLWCELLRNLESRLSCGRNGLPENPPDEKQRGNPAQRESAWRSIRVQLFEQRKLAKLVGACDS